MLCTSGLFLPAAVTGGRGCIPLPREFCNLHYVLFASPAGDRGEVAL